MLSLTALMIEQVKFSVLSFAECRLLQIHCLRGRRNLAKDNNLAQKHLVGMQLKPVGCIHISGYSPDPLPRQVSSQSVQASQSLEDLAFVDAMKGLVVTAGQNFDQLFINSLAVDYTAFGKRH